MFTKAKKLKNKDDALSAIVNTAIKEIEVANISSQEKIRLKNEADDLNKSLKAIFTYNTAPDVEKLYLNTLEIQALDFLHARRPKMMGQAM